MKRVMRWIDAVAEQLFPSSKPHVHVRRCERVVELERRLRRTEYQLQRERMIRMHTIVHLAHRIRRLEAREAARDKAIQKASVN
jgi:hypothetical protein